MTTSSLKNLKAQQNLSCKAVAPTRVDIAGGTLDIWPLAHILQEKFNLWKMPIQTVNIAIDLFAEATVSIEEGSQTSFHFFDQTNQRSYIGESIDHDLGSEFCLHRAVTRFFSKSIQEQFGNCAVKVTTNAMAPKGSGLGGSSSVVVALLSSFAHLLKESHADLSDMGYLCKIAQDLEAGILGGLAGDQDHYAAAIGGIQAVLHQAGKTTSRKLNADGKVFMDHVVLAHSGQQHLSVFNNWLVLEKVLTGDKETLKKCAQIAELTHPITYELEAGNTKKLGFLMSEEWKVRRTLAEGISTPILDKMYDAAIKADALGAKVCGAGGGGVLVVVCESTTHKEHIITNIKNVGGQILKAGYSPGGVQLQESVLTTPQLKKFA